MNTEDFSYAQDSMQVDNQRQAMVAETIDRLQYEYAMGGGAGQSTSGMPQIASRTISEDLLDPASQVQLKSSEDFQQYLGHREDGVR